MANKKRRQMQREPKKTYSFPEEDLQAIREYADNYDPATDRGLRPPKWALMNNRDYSLKPI